MSSKTLHIGGIFLLGSQFVKLIEARLKEIGMKKAEFYRLSGISSATLSQWRTGVYAPSEKSIAKVGDLLGIQFEISEKTEKPVAQNDELSFAQRALIDYVRGLSDQEAAALLVTLKTLKGAPQAPDQNG